MKRVILPIALAFLVGCSSSTSAVVSETSVSSSEEETSNVDESSNVEMEDDSNGIVLSESGTYSYFEGSDAFDFFTNLASTYNLDQATMQEEDSTIYYSAFGSSTNIDFAVVATENGEVINF